MADTTVKTSCFTITTHDDGSRTIKHPSGIVCEETAEQQIAIVTEAENALAAVTGIKVADIQTALAPAKVALLDVKEVVAIK